MNTRLPNTPQINPILTVVSNAIFICNHSLTFDYLSNELLALLGYELEDMKGQSLQIIFAEDIQFAILEQLLSRSDTVRNIEALVKKSDGEVLKGQISVVRTLNEKTSILEYHGLVRDVSLESKAIDILQSHEQELRIIFDSSPMGITVLNQDLRIIKSNHYLSHIMDIMPEDLMDLKFKECLEQKHCEQFESFIDDFIKNNTVEPKIFALKSSPTFPILVRISLAYYGMNLNDKQSRRPYLLLMEDVTKGKLVEEENAKLQQKLFHLEKMDLTNQLTRGFAHDFNNLMTVVNGYIDLLGTFELSAGASGILGELSDTSNKATDMVNRLNSNILRYSKLDVIELCLNVNGLFQRTIIKAISVTTHLDAVWSLIVADESLITNALLNLLINSGEAMEESGEITISCSNLFLDSEFLEKKGWNLETGVYILISIKDTGSGMDEETKLKIFEPYFSTKGKSVRGLGLTIVYNTIINHKGQIEVDSVVGEGTEFRIYLPTVENLSDESVSFHQANSRIPLSDLGKKILVVDDDEGVTNYLDKLLQMAGYQTVIKNNPSEALEYFTQNRHDIGLVTLDLDMPKLSGWDVLDKMREIDSSVRCIVISGSFQISGYREEMEENIYLRIAKPFTKDELISHLSRLYPPKD